MKVHELKAWPDPFDAVKDGRKRFEFRRDDRGYEVGDVLHLRRWLPEFDYYSGGECFRQVTYIARGPAFGIPEGFAVLSIAPVQP